MPDAVLKKIILIGLLSFSLFTLLAAALFVRQFPDSELATFSASVGNLDDCQVGGSPNTMRAGNVIWWYFLLPGVSESYLEEGNSFVSSAFHALTCNPGDPGYEANLQRVKRLVKHAIKHGESIDSLGINRFNLFHGAVIRSDLEFAQFLIANGADPLAVTRDDAVWYAKDYGKLNAFQLAEALPTNAWPVSDEMMAYLQQLKKR